MLETEIRIMAEKIESKLNEYIISYRADGIKIFKKEDWIMIEELKKQREEYVAEVERLKATDLEAIKNARFELVKEKIAEEVKAEFDEKLAEAELNVQHYNFVIETMEAKAIDELPDEENLVCETVENMEG